MDPGTGLTILGSAIGSAKLLEKLLGPTTDYLGEGIRNWTEKRVVNVSRVFQNAADKLGGRIDDPGQVPPKILKGILSEGSFCDDTISADYFGGVLASSRSSVSRDDRGATYIALLSGMSAYQIRTHYVLYTILHKRFHNTVPNAIEHTGGSGKELVFYIPISLYSDSMDPTQEEGEDRFFSVLVQHSMIGLEQRRLIHAVSYGDAAHLARWWDGNEFPDQGITFAPTAEGFDLYLWGHGLGNEVYNNFYKQDFKYLSDVMIPETDSLMCLKSQRTQSITEPDKTPNKSFQWTGG